MSRADFSTTYQQLDKQLEREYAAPVKEYYDARIINDEEYRYVVPIDGQTLRTIERFSGTDERFRSPAGLMFTAGEIAKQFVDTGNFTPIVMAQNYLVEGRRMTAVFSRYREEVFKHVRKLKPELMSGEQSKNTELQLYRSVSICAYIINDTPILMPQELQWRTGYHEILSESYLRTFIAALSSVPSGEPLALGVSETNGTAAKVPPALTLLSENFAVSRDFIPTREKNQQLLRTRALYDKLETPRTLLTDLVGRELPGDATAVAMLLTAALSLEALRREPSITEYDLHELELSFGREITAAIYRGVVERQLLAQYYDSLVDVNFAPQVLDSLQLGPNDPTRVYVEDLVYDQALRRATLAKKQEKYAAQGATLATMDICAEDDLPLFEFCRQTDKPRSYAAKLITRLRKGGKEPPPFFEQLGACLTLEDENILWLDSAANVGESWTHVQLGG